MTGTAALREIVALNRAGRHAGIPSWCTAHRETLQAILRFHRDNEDPILIEATCNQVNQDGGYTGMTPADFRGFVHGLAQEQGIDRRRIVLGGDHLGPSPWRALGARAAMAKAGDMVRLYVQAGFTKIHLDASMACADDGTLAEEEIAARAASLAAMAERHAAGAGLLYVIGTEVPKPGGETERLGGLAVTEPQAMLRTYELHRSAFLRDGLSAALARVIGIVVQPGVDFGNSQIFAFDRPAAARLSAAVSELPDAVFEAHSTDYQTGRALSDLVASHFAILKVGPELTFAYREAVVAMASIEQLLSQARKKSGILKVIGDVMAADPKYWRDYIPEDDRAEVDRLFGLSDRIRYYWPNAAIQQALAQLSANIDAASGELGLVSQFANLPDTATVAGLPLSQQIIHGTGQRSRRQISRGVPAGLDARHKLQAARRARPCGHLLIIDDAVVPRLEFMAVRRGDHHQARACGLGGRDAGRCVLEHQALPYGMAEPPGGKQEAVRRRLAAVDVLRGDNHRRHGQAGRFAAAARPVRAAPT